MDRHSSCAIPVLCRLGSNTYINLIVRIAALRSTSWTVRGQHVYGTAPKNLLLPLQSTTRSPAYTRIQMLGLPIISRGMLRVLQEIYIKVEEMAPLNGFFL
jgi:hypothetical protein